MISQRSEFKSLNRGYEDTALLIPGWAMDYRIFGSLDLSFNYLMPTAFSPFDFEKPFLKALEENGLERVSIFAHSMGNFIAARLVSKYPQKFKTPMLLGARPKYDRNIIEDIKTYIKKNKAGYLYRFYSDCFSENEKEAWSRFRMGLAKDYIKKMRLDALLEGLDYLSAAELRPEDVAGLNAIFIHGSSDKIAPIAEALAFKEKLPDAKFVTIEGAGHVPFLRCDKPLLITGGVRW